MLPNISSSTPPPPRSRQQRRAQQRAEIVRRTVSVMEYLPSNDNCMLTGKGELDVWPGNVSRVVNTPLSPSHSSEFSSITRPPVLEHVVSRIRGELCALAARFPQFRDRALTMPKSLVVSLEETEMFEDQSVQNKDRHYAWWDCSAESKSSPPPPVLDPVDSAAYQNLSRTAEDVFAAARLHVFREAGKQLCHEFRTYRGLLQSVFVEYDRYISFCNEFVLQERSALFEVQRRVYDERRTLLDEVARLQDESRTMVDRLAAAESTLSDKEVECAGLKKDLEETQYKVSLVDKIIADGESDKGILARRLIATEREVQELQNRLKGPEKKIASLEAQLESKEFFVKDISRRYERACNTLDNVKKQLREEQLLERRAQDAQRGGGGGGGKAGAIITIKNASLMSSNSVVKDLSERLTMSQLRCSMLESQLNTITSVHRSVPVEVETQPSSPRIASQVISQQVSPRSEGDGGGQPQTPHSPASGSQTTTAMDRSEKSSPKGKGSTAAPAAAPPNSVAAESVALMAQLHNIAPEQRLDYCVSTISTLLTDLNDVRSSMEQLTAQRASDAAALLLPHSFLYPFEDPIRRFFIGSDPNHPCIFLRATGRVRNQKFSLLAIKSHIHSFFGDLSGIGNLPIVDRFLTWMRNKYGEETSAMCYSFFTALSWFPDDLDAYLFRRLLEEKVPELFWKLPYQVTTRLRELMERTSYRKHGGATIPRREAIDIVSTELMAWDLSRVEDLCQLFSAEDVEWRKLFFASKGKGDTVFVSRLRRHWMLEYLTMFNDVCDHLMEDPQLGAGEVTPASLVRAVLAVDPTFPESTLLEIVSELFGDVLVASPNTAAPSPRLPPTQATTSQTPQHAPPSSSPAVDANVSSDGAGTEERDVATPVTTLPPPPQSTTSEDAPPPSSSPSSLPPHEVTIPIEDRFLLSTATLPVLVFLEGFAKVPLCRSKRREKYAGGIFGLRQQARQQH